MPTLDEEEQADRFYSSKAWLYNQGELVTYLLKHGHPMLAHKAIQGALRHLQMWPDMDQFFLMDAYGEGRLDSRRRWESASHG